MKVKIVYEDGSAKETNGEINRLMIKYNPSKGEILFFDKTKLTGINIDKMFRNKRYVDISKIKVAEKLKILFLTSKEKESLTAETIVENAAKGNAAIWSGRVYADLKLFFEDFMNIGSAFFDLYEQKEGSEPVKIEKIELGDGSDITEEIKKSAFIAKMKTAAEKTGLAKKIVSPLEAKSRQIKTERRK